jgi:hypothetical protein
MVDRVKYDLNKNLKTKKERKKRNQYKLKIPFYIWVLVPHACNLSYLER